ncbi:MAG: asparagine synthetase B, partial [Holosporales bacterium]|nr:asparagine synthetase B [Holosporales bacterium]
MCGVAGSLSWTRLDQPEHVVCICDAMMHRGPDASGVQTSEEVIFGHRRLSILDLTNGADQPMWDHARRFLISFNGEIYNYKEVRALLSQYGAAFRTQSDTEVILEAWKHWGVRALQHFVGMFAFALWDSAAHTLYLARDRMGEKPLYFAPFGDSLCDGVVFASELTALVKHPVVRREVNFDAVVQYLATNYVYSAHSILKNVHKLAPAHVMIFEKGQAPRTECYWALEDFINHKKTWRSETEAQAEFHRLLDQAVTEQRQSDVPLGAFLSGGVDSSTITGALTHADPATTL